MQAEAICLWASVHEYDMLARYARIVIDAFLFSCGDYSVCGALAKMILFQYVFFDN